MSQNFVEWLQGLETQTLTDELKLSIIMRFRDEIEDAVNNNGGLVDEVLWERKYTYTRGEQYYEKRFENKVYGI